jgi:hypothetical protein
MTRRLGFKNELSSNQVTARLGFKFLRSWSAVPRTVTESGKSSHVKVPHCASARCPRCGCFASTGPNPTDDQCRYANLPDGAFDRFDLRIPAADGLPLRSKRSIPARGLCRRYGYDWPRCRHHRRWRTGMGRISADSRPHARKTSWYLCGRQRRDRRRCRRWCEPFIRGIKPFHRVTAAFS